MKLSEAFNLYRDQYMYFTKRSQTMVANNTYYRNSLVGFLGDKELAELTIDDIVRWSKYLSKTRCDNTVRNYVIALRQVIKYARACGYQCISEQKIPSPPRITTTVSYATPEDVQRLIDTSPSIRTKLIISFLYASGVRLSEFLSLNRDSVKDDHSFTVIGKGGKERLCFIDARTAFYLERYLATREDSDPALIVSRVYKTRVSVSNIQQIVREAVRRAGLNKKITPHSFRHGHATNLIANGADIRYVAHDLGHSSLNTTMIYTHIEDPDMRTKYLKFHTI